MNDLFLDEVGWCMRMQLDRIYEPSESHGEVQGEGFWGLCFVEGRFRDTCFVS